MVEAGLTPMQAIVAATGDAAKCHGKAGQIGSIQPGAVADFVVLKGNPLDDIKATRTIESVWIGGRKLRDRARSRSVGSWAQVGLGRVTRIPSGPDRARPNLPNLTRPGPDSVRRSCVCQTTEATKMSSQWNTT